MKPIVYPMLALTAGAALLQAQVYLDEPFSYADGPLATVSSGLWTIHSGTTPLNVASGAVLVDQGDGTSGKEDANRLFTLGGGPVGFAPDGNADNADNLLFASFSVSFSALPNNTTGSYFAHFKSSAASEFYGRIGASILNAPAGKFRLSIGNEHWDSTIAQATQDLDLGVTYRLVTSHNVDTGASQLWINPVDASSASVTATDSRSFDTTGAINAYAIRQGTTGSGATAGAPGVLVMDDLKVGRTFADVTSVIPEPRVYALLLSGLAALGFWRRRAGSAS